MGNKYKKSEDTLPSYYRKVLVKLPNGEKEVRCLYPGGTCIKAGTNGLTEIGNPGWYPGGCSIINTFWKYL